MKRASPYRLRHLFLLAIAAVCIPHAGAQEAAPSHLDPVTELRFPQKLSRMHFTGVRHFDSKKLGYCVLYASEASNGQVCVYDLGHENLPTGVDSPAFKEALQLAEEGFVKSLNSAPYSNGKIFGVGTPSIDGDGKSAKAEARFLSSELTLPDNSKIQNTHLLLMTTGLGKILKLNYSERNTTATAFAEETRQIVEDFVRFNGATMKKLLVEAPR